MSWVLQVSPCLEEKLRTQDLVGVSCVGFRNIRVILGRKENGSYYNGLYRV